MYLMNPTEKSPERALALQKYLLLHSQHDRLQKRLNHITTSLPTTSYSLPSPDRPQHEDLLKLSESDDRYLHPVQGLALQRQLYRSGSIANAQYIQPTAIIRRSSQPDVIDEDILGEIGDCERELDNVNRQIKCTLMDLLNCKGVKENRRYRMWVQDRLMVAERELSVSRSQKRSTCASVLMQSFSGLNEGRMEGKC
jgi:hypothetical protein